MHITTLTALAIAPAPLADSLVPTSRVDSSPLEQSRLGMQSGRRLAPASRMAMSTADVCAVDGHYAGVNGAYAAANGNDHGRSFTTIFGWTTIPAFVTKEHSQRKRPT